MLAFFSVFHGLLNYLRKGLIYFWLLGLWGCKDFKNWESIYGNVLNIKFEKAMDEWAPGVLEDLGSEKLSELHFLKNITFPNKKNDSLSIINSDDDKILQLTTNLRIELKPNTNQVSVKLIGATNKQNPYHQKVTIYYETIVSMISPQAGGLQIQYRIKDIQFDKNTNKPIFKRFAIEHPVLLKKEEAQSNANVTLYY
ncbi:hypothetical protein ACRRVB_02965 [Candidatus Cardinium hertigii]|uniref:hypothetical protein n=1 Tax=Candidatus Cardinium hertigii TaxID=247481 RepID=UPI003D7D7175